MRQLETSSRLVCDYFATKINDINTTSTLQSIEWTFMRQIREVKSNFENISRDCRAIASARDCCQSRDVTFVRVSHDVPTNVAYFHSYDSRETFVRVSHEIRTNVAFSFIVSPDSREVFACFLKTVARLSYNIRTSVAKISHC